jgi:ribosomal protein L3 glutamine methyltransferase
VPYLTGEAWIGDFRFFVDRRVLIPRSFIGDLLLEGLSPWVPDLDAVGTALDLCTGSGCLAILMAHAFPNADVDAADLSPAAIDVAHRNVGEYGCGDRVHLVQSDLFAALAGKRYDVIVSNPPYVDAPSMAELPREFRHEPELALAAGDDGLDLVRRILAEAGDHLNPAGVLIVEIGHNRAALEAAYPDTPFTWLSTHAGDDFVFLLGRDQLPT